MSFVVPWLILALTCNIAYSVELKDIAETCPGNFITQDYKENWDNAGEYTSDVSFYTPLASKSHVFFMAQNLFQTRDFKYLTESHLENSCLTLNKIDGWDLANVTGYDARSLPIQLIRTDIPKLFRFYLPYPNGGLTGYASIALTDNQSYNLFDYCFDNGLRSFAVVSNVGFLDETKLAVIKAHVKSLGFKERNFVHLNYVSCFDANGKLVGNVEDLPKPASPASILFRNYDYPLLTDNLLHSTAFFYKKK